MTDKCPICGDELFDVFLGSDRMYSDIDNKRCMKCNTVFPFKKKIYKKNEDKKNKE
jgi:hypothetical protein